MFNKSGTLSIAGISDHEIVKEFKERSLARGVKIWFAALQAFALWIEWDKKQDDKNQF